MRIKHETCKKVGIASHHIDVAASAGQGALLAAVDQFNDDDAVHGYLIQLPVPSGFDANAALLAVDPAKDADGLHPVNLGKLVLQQDGPVPCTPAGIQALFVHYGIDIAGREVCIVGRGPTLGRPLVVVAHDQAAGCQRCGHRRAHGREEPRRLHAARRHRRGRGGCAEFGHPRHGEAGRRSW